MPNAEPQIIFDAKTQRYGGLFSKANAATLPLGTYSVAKNWRFDENLPRGRWGMGRPTSSAISIGGNGSTLGSWCGTLNGAPYLIIAHQNSSDSKVQLYSVAITSGGLTSTVNTLTAASGKYGATELTYGSASSASSPVSFAPVKDRSNGKEYLVIGFGDGYCRVFDPSATSAQQIAINQPMGTTPEKTPIRSAVVAFPVYVNLSDPANQTYSTLDADITGADATTSPNNYAVFVVKSTVDVSDYVQIDYASTLDFSSSRQIIVYYETEYTTFWEKFKFEIGEGGSMSTVWDPAASPRTNNPIIIPADTSGKKWYAVFSLDHIAAASRNAVDDFKFTFARGSAPSSDQTVNIYGIFGSGKILGQAYHALSYFNSGSRAESAGIWYGPEHYAGEGLRNLGVRASDEGTLPNDPRVYYDYKLFINSPVTADVQAGWDYIRIYRSDVGEDPLLRTLVTSTLVAQYTAGNWVYESGFATGALATLTDNTAVGSKNTAVPAPDYNTLTIPKSAALLYEAGRLFSISYAFGTPTATQSPSTLWASDLGHFSRFRYFPESEDQGTTSQFTAELGMELRAMPTSLRGVPSCYLWTDNNLYRFTPTTATQISALERVAPYGTRTKFSVATSKDSIYWLDQERIVRRLSPGGIDDLSSLAVDDKIGAIGGATWGLLSDYQGWYLAWGTFHREKYYLSFDRAGGVSLINNQDEPMVFDERSGVWVEDDLGSTTYSARCFTPRGGKLYCVSKDRQVYEYEQTNAMTDGYDSNNPTPGGTAFDLTLETGYLQMADGMGFVVDQSAVMCDDVASGTCTVTATYLPDASAPTMTIDVDDSSSVLWSMSTKPTAVSGKGQGVAAKLKAVFASTAGIAGMRLYKWAAFVSPRAGRPTNYNT